jgi:hypothetical protein
MIREARAASTASLFTNETSLVLVGTIDTWYRAKAGMKSGPVTAKRHGVPEEIALPCCGSRFSTYEIDPTVGVGPLRLTERARADRCGHVEAFLQPPGMALTGGYLSPPRRAWELLRRGIDPPAGLR